MKLSIITINLNNADGLARTIESVIKQSFKEFEYIIIDGCSTDDSVKIIKKYAYKIDYWISEKDNGVYNAMNKGIKKAKGKYLLMLNSGDCLYKDTTLLEVFKNHNYEQDILFGNATLESKGKIVGIKKFDKPITFDFFRRSSLCHQATFIRRGLHDVLGLYDEELVFSSDRKFFTLAFCKYNVSSKYLNIFISQCNCDGLTWRPSNFAMMRTEKDQILKEYFPNFILDYEHLDNLKNKKNLFTKMTDLVLGVPKKVFRSWRLY